MGIMATRFVMNVLLLLSLLFASLSNAGHSAWEAGATTFTSEWIHIDPSFDFPTWPHETIRYYFSTPEMKEEFANDIRAAWQLWYAAGLPETFRFIEYSRARCEAAPDDCLLIIAEYGAPSFFTSLGRQRIDPWDRNVMYLAFQGTEDEHDKAVIIAHEIGHAWGLLHEHQNPLFWQWAFRGTRSDSLVQFYCENVLGFAEVEHEVNNTLLLWAEDGPCRDQARAYEFGFLASEMIPWRPRYQQPHRLWPHDSDVDWDSIMIYESHSFGVDDEHGNKKLTLVRTKDLQVIPEPGTVTELDVVGMVHLYHPRYGKFREVFHNDASSAWYAVFKDKIKNCLIKT
ncbi:hypothetical protein BDV38DRAFT_259800 [Aspergillus pseudotamarii]|uniref:Peptidase metallopeptidase domain-containing protein n=1 Tax=Aspergillus pseudotamarii TaxID=132259 RepID=A0A5N6SGL0_ASPPS|nr:uncharacterized protein BDV38DRAFT_259800 [Aspergillus pseudotamarii]KAE8133019.1 hypothetical protein BDV38DRAFT_259800 [Aspergillus pseudotamarii]